MDAVFILALSGNDVLSLIGTGALALVGAALFIGWNCSGGWSRERWEEEIKREGEREEQRNAEAAAALRRQWDTRGRPADEDL